jgi:hypothetical protein
MNGACSTHGRDQKCVKIFWFDSLKGRDHLLDLGENGGYIKMDLRVVEFEGVDWDHLADDRDWRLALVNTAVILRVS